MLRHRLHVRWTVSEMNRQGGEVDARTDTHCRGVEQRRGWSRWRRLARLRRAKRQLRLGEAAARDDGARRHGALACILGGARGAGARMVSAASAHLVSRFFAWRARLRALARASRALEDAARMGRPVAVRRVLELWRHGAHVQAARLWRTVAGGCLKSRVLFALRDAVATRQSAGQPHHGGSRGLGQLEGALLGGAAGERSGLARQGAACRRGRACASPAGLACSADAFGGGHLRKARGESRAVGARPCQPQSARACQGGGGMVRAGGGGRGGGGAAAAPAAPPTLLHLRQLEIQRPSRTCRGASRCAERRACGELGERRRASGAGWGRLRNRSDALLVRRAEEHVRALNGTGTNASSGP